MPTDSFPLFGEMRWTSAELAAALLLTTQRVTQLSKEHVLPPAADGLYTPVESVANYIRYLRQREAGKSQAGEVVKKIQLENQMRSIKLQKIAGELVPVSGVQADWFRVGRQIRDSLQNIPSRLCGPLAAETRQEKIFERLTEEIRIVLTELSGGTLPPPGQKSTEPEQSPGATDQPAEISTSQPADSIFDEAFMDRDHGADDPGDRFPTGD